MINVVVQWVLGRCWYFIVVRSDSQRTAHEQIRRQRGSVVPGPSNLNPCLPISCLTPGCCIHPILYLENVPTLWFLAPLLRNPGDGLVLMSDKVRNSQNQTFRFASVHSITPKRHLSIVKLAFELYSSTEWTHSDTTSADRLLKDNRRHTPILTLHSLSRINLNFNREIRHVRVVRPADYHLFKRVPLIVWAYWTADINF